MTTAPTEQQTAEVVTEDAPGRQMRWQQFMIVGALVVLFVIFTIASPNFLTVSNVGGILLAASVTGILALGTSFVIATGGIDLSVGTTMTLVSVMLAVFGTSNYLGLPFPVAIVLALAFGALLGLLVGFLVSHLGIPPFIATLAMMMATQGASLIITGSTPQYFTEVDGFRNLATGQLIPKLPNAVLIFLVLAVVAWFLMNKTLIGRYAVSIGSNEEATKVSGVDTRRWKLYIYLTAFVFTAIAGIVMASRLNSAQPALGVGYELEAIAAVVIGGTSLAGGRASIIGTVVGATLMATLNNGLQILGIAQEWQRIAVAVVIIIAVWADTVRRRRSGEA
ncbi:monosaccharide ABC transporter membrane protein (CUT2 family) [Georgenia soli]|uniref:Monosaccharide ABC transporter membrane protein (CUT2 family) n=1 Tax=Georgenia soli TaxID=638953 RepID=A0A2A9ES07_9MICO|nr:ABC transporter permease [Georgenia soli]PFG41052.1 monosaccharide ABC transporter membrane protein (CUT2 family) [Georgenia soli]